MAAEDGSGGAAGGASTPVPSRPLPRAAARSRQAGAAGRPAPIRPRRDPSSDVRPAPPPSAPPPPPTDVRTRTGLRLALAGALLVGTAGAALLWAAVGDRAGDLATAPAPARTSSSSPGSPIPLTADAEHVVVEVLDDGDLRVSHWLRTTAPMDHLALRVPPSSGLTAEAIGVSGLVVVADGVLVDAPVRDARVRGWMGAVPDARDLYVRYDLSGVSQRSGSATGRALATVTALTLGVGSDPLTRTQTFTGSKFLALACLARGARATPQPCGSLVAGSWTLDFAPDAAPDTVIAQLDLEAGPAGR